MNGRKWVNLCCVATIVFVAASGVVPDNIHASTSDLKEIAPVASGGVLEGRVIEAENLTLVVAKANGEVVRVPMPGKSGESASDYSKGDYIEVAISPEGITTSVRKVAKGEY